MLPRFDAAEKSLQALPRSTATQAMMLGAKLASGDAHAWKSVKKMRAGQDVLTARVGIHYRALLRIGDGALECLKVVHRKKLDAALDQFRS